MMVDYIIFNIFGYAFIIYERYVLFCMVLNVGWISFLKSINFSYLNVIYINKFMYIEYLVNL